MMNNQSVSRIIGVKCTRGFSRVRFFYVHKRLFLVAIGKVFLAFLVGFLFFSFIEAGASPVGVKRARKVAQNFLLSQHLNGATKGDIKLDYVSRELGFRNVHIFQMPDGGGFVIVAGDDCMHPIVGYGTENGERRTENGEGERAESGDRGAVSSAEGMSPALRGWLEGCERMARVARSESWRQTEEVAEEWRALEDDEPGFMQAYGGIPALMATRWNQSPLYNDSCPYDAGAGTRVVTGCVATAMGQVMAYWKRPVTGQGAHSYTHQLYGTLSANFGNTHYDWANMPYSLDGNSSSAEIRAEAQLVFHCGVAVEMGYGVGGSGSYVSSYGDPTFPSAENALRNYFRFKPTLHCIYEDNMTTEQWLDSIKKDLFAGRPIIFAGYQSSGGHAFVVDGYDAFDRVHVNWGWGGFGDGYFTLSPLPMYSASCQAVVGIEPEGVLYGNKTFYDNIDENGMDDTVTIFTNNQNSSSWVAYANRTWITVSPTSGVGGGASASIAIHVDTNLTGQNRSGNVIVRQGQDSINIPIVQFGYNGEDQVLPDDDTITMSQLTGGEVQVDTIYPGVHYTIMDPGGLGPYPSNCNAKHHLVSSQGSYLIMDVDYDIQPGSDWLRIYDSDEEAVQLTNYSGVGSAPKVVCYSGHAFLSFHSDTYTPQEGYVIHIYACDTFEAEVRNVVSVVSGTNTITLSWIDTSSADQWRIKWGTDPRNLDQYREVTETTTRFTNLDLENNQYYFRIYNNAGAADTGNLCMSRLAMGQPDDGCPGSSIVDVELFDVLNHSVKLRWRDLSTSDGDPLHWKVRYGRSRNNLDQLAETDTNYIRLTGLTNGVEYYYRIYNNTVSTDTSSVCFLMPIGRFETQWCVWDSMDIREVTTYNVTGTSLDVGWTDYGGGTHWTLRLFRESGAVDYQCDTPYVHIDGLQRGRSYDIVIYNNTGQTQAMECQQHHSVETLCEGVPGQCVNFADLTTCLVEPWTGDYSNPHANRGVVDYGPSNVQSRHVVGHVNQADPRTGGNLMSIPPGETASVRLGNWMGGAESESLSYLYDVDTTSHDLLILKYAAVLENPNHTADEQPRFTLRIVDEFGDPINDNCYYFDFVSDTGLGWNVYNHVLWKDWTTVGVDLTPLHGRRIKVELTTRDCNQGNHFGYAYFVLKCARKEITAEMCGNSLHNVFHVPEGFAYRWYEASAPSVTLSTTSTLTVDTAGDFRCQLSPVGSTNSSCSFEMRCQAGYRFPHSVFSYAFGDTIEGCLQRIQFANQSEVTGDEEHQLPLGETINTVMWDFGDGTMTYDVDPYHDFAPGQHTVTLYCSLSNGACVDTLQQTIEVGPVCPTPDTVYSVICEGDTLTFYDKDLTVPGVYDYHDGFWWHTIVLDVLPDSYASFADTVVQNDLPVTFLDTTVTVDMLDNTAPFSYFSFQFTIQNYLGCDSVVDWTLVVWHNRESWTDTLVCPEDLPLMWNGIAVTDTGSVVAHLLTTKGADSTAHLHLLLHASPTALMQISPEKVTMDNYNNVLLKDISSGGVGRTWYLPDVTDERSSWTYSYPIPADSVEVVLVAVSGNGCLDTALGTIYFVNTTFYAPNAFTPDEMGSNSASLAGNNKFQIFGNNLIDLEVYIYDRWGMLVCTWKGPDGFWDGTYKGQECPQGAYVWLARYYTADAPETRQVRKGTVLLLR